MKKIWIVIPARKNSKGLKNKNIYTFLKKPLIEHTIHFAKKLNNISKIFVSTDSSEIRNIAKKNSVSCEFLRSKNAAKDNSMEEDILLDLKKKLKIHNIKQPDSILWLRPTHPIRDLKIFQSAINEHLKTKKTILMVTKTDSRIFFGSKKYLKPILKVFHSRSMVRRQDSPHGFKIFHGEIFEFPKKITKKYLGRKLMYKVLPSECNLDIDNITDIIIGETIYKKNKSKYKYYVH
jgi:CMP-N,N'-diacetyllegionaminic acid synthase